MNNKVPKYIGDFFHYSASIAYDPDAQTLPEAVVGYTFSIRPINRYQSYELDQTLEALGYTEEQVNADPRLKAGLEAALKPYYEEEA